MRKNIYTYIQRISLFALAVSAAWRKVIQATTRAVLLVPFVHHWKLPLLREILATCAWSECTCRSCRSAGKQRVLAIELLHLFIHVDVALVVRKEKTILQTILGKRASTSIQRGFHHVLRHICI